MSATGRAPGPTGSKLKSMLAVVAYVTVRIVLNKSVSMILIPSSDFNDDKHLTTHFFIHKVKLKSTLCQIHIPQVSMLMTLLNKHIISYVKFPGTNFLLLSECIICSLLLGIYRWGQFDPFNGNIFRFLSVCTIAKAGNM